MDKAKFFAAIRRALFPKGLDAEQVYRIETLVDAIGRVQWKPSYAAYALATAHHETANWNTMREKGGDAYFKRMYDKAGERPKKAAELGNVEAGDGVRFFGRGYVQLTGRSNYVKAGKALGLDLLKDPAIVEDPSVAARVLIWGMATGAYTGKANRDYLDKPTPDYVNARRIINGTDKASLIAGYAREFEAALRAAGYGEVGRAVGHPPIAPIAPISPISPISPTEPAKPAPAPADHVVEPNKMVPAPAPPAPAPRQDGTYAAPASEGWWHRLKLIFGL